MKKFRGVIAFFGSFLLYQAIGFSIFPVNEDNILQAPGWYPFVGTIFVILVTVLVSYKKKPKKVVSVSSILDRVDNMDGHDFEYWCANLLRKNGYSQVKVTPGSGDQGVDILAVKDGVKFAIQCKRYSSDLGNTPIQEVSAGKQYYHCQVGVVMTNSHFTKGAKDLARATDVRLWDREKLKEFIRSASRS